MMNPTRDAGTPCIFVLINGKRAMSAFERFHHGTLETEDERYAQQK
jgi:hypothetical protein